MAASQKPGSRPVRRSDRLARVAARVVRWERARGTRIELTLLDATTMRRLNRRATGRRGLTDVIAFTLPQPDGTTLGDVYVCPEAARRQPHPATELIRLAVHGTLHVLGYDHPEGPGRMRSTMWRRQERYLRRLVGRP